ncbi:MAG: hypothetical protein JW904_07325 [Spirochaetales bacterium]|nr:hypothetical protein [Spirochaetales bacterium]
MANNDRRMDSLYSEYDTRHANGFLFVLFLWLVAANPLLVVVTSYPMISFYSTYMPELGMEWINSLMLIAVILMIFFTASGILLGLALHKLKKPAWILLKFYFPVVQVFYCSLVIPAFPALPVLDNAGLLANSKLSAQYFSTDFSFRITSSMIISFVWFLYLLLSKNGPAQFPRKDI